MAYTGWKKLEKNMMAFLNASKALWVHFVGKGPIWDRKIAILEQTKVYTFLNFTLQLVASTWQFPAKNKCRVSYFPFRKFRDDYKRIPGKLPSRLKPNNVMVQGYVIEQQGGGGGGSGTELVIRWWMAGTVRMQTPSLIRLYGPRYLLSTHTLRAASHVTRQQTQIYHHLYTWHRHAANLYNLHVCKDICTLLFMRCSH